VGKDLEIHQAVEEEVAGKSQIIEVPSQMKLNNPLFLQMF